MDDGDLDYLESQNEEKIHGLSAKVAILKNVRLPSVFAIVIQRLIWSCVGR